MLRVRDVANLPGSHGERVPWRYDLASVMILTVIVAVGLALSLRADTLPAGLPVLLLGPPTLIRSAPVLIHRRRAGRAGRWFAMIELVFLSLAIASALLAVGFFSALIVFVLTRAVHDLDKPALLLSKLASAGLVGLLAVYYVGRDIFPPRDHPP